MKLTSQITGGAEQLLNELLTLVTPQTETLEGCYEQLDSDRDALAEYLNNKGQTATTSETFTELVPKVNDIVVPIIDGSLQYPFYSQVPINVRLTQLNGVDIEEE